MPTDNSPLLPWLIGAGILVPIVVVGVFIATRPEPDLPNAADDLQLGRRNVDVQRGGVTRPASDLVAKPPSRKVKPISDKSLAQMVGRTQKLEADANAATESLVEAVRSREHSGRMSVMMEADAFDAQAYKQDPASYLAIYEPARVWQTAKPGEGVPVLKPVSSRRQGLVQGESVRLKVKTAPNSPVTFASFDLGAFDNGLTSISVGANDQGEAEATLHTGAGTIGEVNVLAGSPGAADTVRFTVSVRLPQFEIAAKE